MICGIGCDITKVSRFEKWVKSPQLLERFFNKKEMFLSERASVMRLCEYYAVRFAAKESFSKALGTGLKGFSLNEVFIEKDCNGKPLLRVTGKALEAMENSFGKDCILHVSLSHEKEYALAYVIIERG